MEQNPFEQQSKVLQELMGIMNEIHGLANNDAEFSVMQDIIAKYRAQEYTAEEALTKAHELRDLKQAYEH